MFRLPTFSYVPTVHSTMFHLGPQYFSYVPAFFWPSLCLTAAAAHAGPGCCYCRSIHAPGTMGWVGPPLLPPTFRLRSIVQLFWCFSRRSSSRGNRSNSQRQQKSKAFKPLRSATFRRYVPLRSPGPTVFDKKMSRFGSSFCCAMRTAEGN